MATVTHYRRAMWPMEPALCGAARHEGWHSELPEHVDCPACKAALETAGRETAVLPREGGTMIDDKTRATLQKICDGIVEDAQHNQASNWALGKLTQLINGVEGFAEDTEPRPPRYEIGTCEDEPGQVEYLITDRKTHVVLARCAKHPGQVGVKQGVLLQALVNNANKGQGQAPDPIPGAPARPQAPAPAPTDPMDVAIHCVPITIEGAPDESIKVRITDGIPEQPEAEKVIQERVEDREKWPMFPGQQGFDRGAPRGERTVVKPHPRYPFKLVLEEATEFQKEFQASQQAMMDKIIQSIADQREEILRAFVAKHGADPDRVEQVQVNYPEGGFTWYVRLRPRAPECGEDGPSREKAAAEVVDAFVAWERNSEVAPSGALVNALHDLAGAFGKAIDR